MLTSGLRRLSGFVWLATLLVMAQSAAGQNMVRRVTLAEALQEFTNNSLALKIARSEAAEIAGAARQSRAYSNPSFTFGRDDLGHEAEEFWEETYHLTQEVEWPGLTKARDRAASHAINASKARLRADSIQLVFEVREAYSLAWFAEEVQGILVQAVTVIQRVADDAEDRLAAGDISDYETRRLRIERRRAEQDVAVAGLQSRAARRYLATLISPGSGMEEIGPAAALEGVPPPITREGALNALPRRPDLQAAVSELNAAQAEIGVAELYWVPAPTLGLGYRHHLDGFAGVSLSVDLPLPVFDRGAGGREETLARRSVAEYRLDLRRKLAENDVLATLDRYATSRARLEMTADALTTDGQALLSSATAAYGEQEMTLLELLDATGAFQDAHLTALSLRSEAWIAYYDLLRAMGLDPGEE